MIAGASRGGHMVLGGWHLLPLMVPNVCSLTFLHAILFLDSFSMCCLSKLWEGKWE